MTNFCLSATVPDYEYRDLTDYSDSGVFIDSVPLKTTPLPRHEKKHHRTNRLSKLRKFFEVSTLGVLSPF